LAILAKKEARPDWSGITCYKQKETKGNKRGNGENKKQTTKKQTKDKTETKQRQNKDETNQMVISYLTSNQ
jgi:hypothetical protein